MPDRHMFLKLLPEDKRRPFLQLIELWRDLLAGTGAVPRRSDMSPSRLRSIASYVSLLDYDGDSALTYRLASQEVTERMGRNPVGLNLFDYMNAAMHDIFRTRIQMAKSMPCGYFSYYRLERPTGSHEQIMSVLLPLRGNKGDAIEHFVALYVSAEIIDWQTSERSSVFVNPDGAVGGWFDIGFGTPKPVSRD